MNTKDETAEYRMIGNDSAASSTRKGARLVLITNMIASKTVKISHKQAAASFLFKSSASFHKKNTDNSDEKP
jgi:hypothetical protein